LYLPCTAPHWPLHAREEDIEPYKGKYAMGWDALREQRYARMRQMGLIDPSWPLSPRDEESPPWEDVENNALEQRRTEVYAAMITVMDRAIGRVLDQIRSMGRGDDTRAVPGRQRRLPRGRRHPPGNAPQYLGRPGRHARTGR